MDHTVFHKWLIKQTTHYRYVLGHITDVTRTGCARLGSAARRVSFYESMDGGGVRPSGPSSGSSDSVRVYIRVM